MIDTPLTRTARLRQRLAVKRRVIRVCWLLLSFLSGQVFAAGALNNIYLYRSPATTMFFQVNGSDYSAMLQPWREYLKSFGRDFREVRKKDLLAGLEPGVLVLGSTLLLGEDERSAINAYLQRGGSLLATWGTGARDGRGRWNGYRFIEKTFDMTVDGEINADSERLFMMPNGDGPLTWPLPAGMRMYMGKVAEPLLRIHGPQLAARYMDWGRTPSLDTPDGAISYAEIQGARRVYLSFPESTWSTLPDKQMRLMLDAVMSWLRRQPRSWLAAWPKGKLAAGLLEMDTEDKFPNAINFADDLEKAGIQGTFYCLTSEAIKYPDVVRQLRQRGHELAYHADIHIGFAGQPAQQQEERLQSMLEQMGDILGPDTSMLTGFRAPTESYDRITELLLRKYGMRHHAADPASTEARLPFFSAADPRFGVDDALVVLPRTNYDDINFKTSGFDDERIAKQLVRDFEESVEMGALGLLSVHSQSYGPEGSMTLGMPTLLRYIGQRREKIWLVRADEITEWWRKRAHVSLTSDPNGTGETVDILVRPPVKVDGLTVMVTHPARGKMPIQVRALTTGAPETKLMPVDEYRTAIVLGNTSPGSYRFEVKF
ncbi:polysaccharide deacetylase family protein [Noviherbaspirillum galbum]|uniref:Polysaccharide deacetylase family protein n=1 Tax=Noviherbaspirillum galbum TaxID=2709383 RepID=A0A6B3SV30_9BURK|nr:polysaccharide deacetylase family protein [Noviherbaspirillum galbum]NEX64577.1 polysaccharide deacetylase family protein [Noviherbaspirillum galbum]